MSETIARQETLDLLARGKITIDEAVDLLGHTHKSSPSESNEDIVYKAEVRADLESGKTIRVNKEDIMSAAGDEKNSVTEAQVENNKGRDPRWLRIRVANLDTGKSKVSINVPFPIVRFGLGVARVFSPEINGKDLDEIGEMFSTAEQGLLVDVEDAESNEHVQIYLD